MTEVEMMTSADVAYFQSYSPSECQKSVIVFHLFPEEHIFKYDNVFKTN